MKINASWTITTACIIRHVCGSSIFAGDIFYNSKSIYNETILFVCSAYRNFFIGTCEAYFFSPGADMSLRSSSNDDDRNKLNCTSLCSNASTPICAESVNKGADDEDLLDFKSPCHLANYNCLNGTSRKRLKYNFSQLCNMTWILAAYRNFFNGSCEEYFFSPGADNAFRSNPNIPINTDCSSMCTDDMKPLCAQSLIKTVNGEELLDFTNLCQLANFNCMHRTARKLFRVCMFV